MDDKTDSDEQRLRTELRERYIRLMSKLSERQVLTVDHLIFLFIIKYKENLFTALCLKINNVVSVLIS